MSITRRRLLGLTGALAALAIPVTAHAEASSPPETFTMVRAGAAVIVTDANGEQVYIKGGDAEICRGSAARLGAIWEAVRAHADDGVYVVAAPSDADQQEARSL